MNTELTEADIVNLIKGLGAAYLKKHYFRYLAKRPSRYLSPTCKQQFIDYIDQPKFMDTLKKKITIQIRKKYSYLTDNQIHQQFDLMTKEYRNIFLEKIKLTIDQHQSTITNEESPKC